MRAQASVEGMKVIAKLPKRRAECLKSNNM